VSRLEETFASLGDDITSFTWVTHPIHKIESLNLTHSTIQEPTQKKYKEINLRGVQPNVFEPMELKFREVEFENTTTWLSYGEQLYTARGSQGVGLS